MEVKGAVGVEGVVGVESQGSGKWKVNGEDL